MTAVESFELQARRDIAANKAEIRRLEAKLSRNWIEQLRRRPPLRISLGDAPAADVRGQGEADLSDSTAKAVPRVKRDWLSRG